MAAMNDYNANENQTLQDVSTHVYGSADMAMDLALLNNISLTDNLQAGQIIKWVSASKNILVIKALVARKIIPATELNEAQKTYLTSNFGIGKMALESTFIIR